MEYNVDNSFIHYNESVFNIFKSKNKTLELINFNNNKLTLGSKSINLGYYRLSTIPLMVVMKDAVTFFDIVDISSKLANNLWQNNNTSYELKLLLNNNSFDENGKKQINDFYNLYNKISQYEDYLIDELATEYSNMKQVINSILYFTPDSEMNEAKRYFNDLMINEKKGSNDKGKEKSLVRSLTNPNFPVTDEIEQNNDLDNYGFISIIVVVLVIASSLVFLIKNFFFK